MKESSPRYPDVVVSLDGEPFEVFNRVVIALRDGGVRAYRRDQFIVEATQGEGLEELQRVCRRWVTEEGGEGA